MKKITHDVPRGVLQLGRTYEYQVQYKDRRLGWSNLSDFKDNYYDRIN